MTTKTYEDGLIDGAYQAIMCVEVYSPEGMMIADQEFAPESQSHREWRANTVANQIVAKLNGYER